MSTILNTVNSRLGDWGLGTGKRQGAGGRETRGKFPLLITHYSLLITHYPLPITHYPLPITHYPLPNAPCPILFMYN
ncbi:hypothetical protein NIES2107_68600 (plasmid) [Nostoc carneum NIES-2107]|nr:hypothetical protein NIES2107_68600 [Nostoc carneum NIES-2107]